MHITVYYSCKKCGLKKVPCQVLAREPNEDVVTWMERLAFTLARDHDHRSINCRPKTLDEIMIPMVGTERVGGPTVQ